MISRHWRGVAKTDLAEAYVDHLRHDTFPSLARIPGFIQASILRRDVTTGTEFQIVTVWESLGAIRAFAGEQHGQDGASPLISVLGGRNA